MGNQYFKMNHSSKFFSALLVVSMAIDVYLVPFFPSLSFGELIVIIVGSFLLIKKGYVSRTCAFPALWLFIIYSIIISVLNMLIIENSLIDISLRLLRDGTYWFIILFFCRSLIDFKTFIKWVLIFCIVLSAFIIIQTAVYYITGYFIPGFYLNALVNDNQYFGYQIYEHTLKLASYSFLRPNGFLCEPANCAQVLFIGLVVAFNTKFRHRGIVAVLFSTAMLLTLSASAFVYLIVAWLLYFVANRKSVMKNISILVLMLLMLVVVASFFNISGFEFVISRLTRITSGDGADEMSTFLRLIRGFEDWSKLPLFNQFFGAGFGSWEAANKIYGFSTEQIGEYMNTISYILFSTGLLGFILFISTMFVFFKKGNSLVRTTIVALLLICSCSSVYSTFVFLWAMTIVITSMPHKNEHTQKGVVYQNARPQYTY